LRRFDLACDTVADGRQALQAVQAKRYDLVFMDGSMPEMDGFESTRAIRAWEKKTGQPALPIIALTAHVVGSHADAWKTSGMDGVLHKPFTLAAMGRMLETHLMGRTPHADRRIAAGDATSSAAPQVATPLPTTPVLPEPSPKPPSPALATQAEEDVPVLDPTTTGQLLGMVKGGGGAAVARIYRLYLENGPPALAEIDAAIAAGDAARVARAAHALKSMSLSLGAVRVAGFAGELEKAGRQDQARLYPGLRELTASHLDEAYAAIARLQAENEFTTEDAASAA